MTRKKYINGVLNIYCKENGKYYPKFKTVNGIEMQLDEKYFIYILSGNTLDENIKQNKNDPYSSSFDLDKDEENNFNFYENAREKFLRIEKPELYSQLKEKKILNDHLNYIGISANKLEDELIAQYSKAENLTEDLKRENMMQWVQEYNSIKNRVKEVILNEHIYV